MSNQSINTGWTSIDDGHEVPVRLTGQKATAQGSSVIIGDSMLDTHVSRTNNRTHVVTEIDPKTMHLSAAAGIGIVLIGAAFYFGILNLRGSVTDGSTSNTPTTAIVTMTEQNTFDPPLVTVDEGTSITFVNKNQNPQVLKPKETKDSLFPVEVVFKDPVTVMIPSGKSGQYHYVSETMPADQDHVLTIDVRTAKKVAVTKITTPAVPVEQMQEGTPKNVTDVIPLPFTDITTPVPVVPSVTEGSPEPTSILSVKAQEFIKTEHGSDAAVISLGGGSEAPAPVDFTPGTVAINPYTVEEGKKNVAPSTSMTETTKAAQRLHSGAPLRALRAHTPVRISETGPQDLWVILILATIGFGVVYQRLLKRI